MKAPLCLATALALATSSCCTMRTQVVDGIHPKHTFHWKSTRRADIPYLLHLPRGYSPDRGTRWPLLIFLHGSGERGTNVQRVAVHGPLKQVRQGMDLPFVIVAPLCPAGQRWQNDSLNAFLDHVLDEYRVDPDRVYLTGLSMGGYGTWSWGVTRPDRFAAIAPICGGADVLDIVLAKMDHKKALQSLPVWAFHGAKDPVVPVDESARAVDLLKKNGAKNVKLTIYPEADHDSWTETYKNRELYDWLLKQRR